MNAVLEWLKPIVIFPLNVLVVIPAILLHCTGYTRKPNGLPWTIAGGVLLALGLALAAWTMGLFACKGKGTPAPWNPPKHLVTAGPYAYVRNPMLIGVFMMQSAECLLLNSWVLFGLLVLFLSGSLVYFSHFEERDLEKRFGPSYVAYRRNVPRWIPRLTPWKSPQPAASESRPGHCVS
jgi:protein-S-isoprenylcysteine O-methyltransferase Ste14